MSIEIKGIKKSYGDFSVCLDFSVEKGETLALVGPSGSGKTTALNLIAGLAEPDEGSVIIDGEDAGALPCWKRNISLVFQDLALFPHLDVAGNIAYGLRVKKVPRKERREIIESVLDLVRLPSYASRKIHTLSGGERQRVAIARALASKPAALLLDEPFSSLDAPLRKEMRAEFLEIRKRSNVPCIFVTHDQEEAAMLGDRIALMAGGRVIETADARDIFLAPRTEAAARFFGAGQVLPCVIAGESGGDNAADDGDAAASSESGKSAGIKVSSPLGVLTVPASQAYDPSRPMIFIPNDALIIGGAGDDAVNTAEPRGSGWKQFNAKYTGSVFYGGNTRVRFLLPARGNGETVPFEVSVGPRMPLPQPEAGETRLYVNERLVRFVRCCSTEQII